MKQVDWDKPLQTRQGNRVRVLCKNLGGRRPVAIAIRGSCDSSESVCSVSYGGRAVEGRVTAADIINAPEVLTQHDLKPGDTFKFVGKSSDLRGGELDGPHMVVRIHRELCADGEGHFMELGTGKVFRFCESREEDEFSEEEDEFSEEEIEIIERA